VSSRSQANLFLHSDPGEGRVMKRLALAVLILFVTVLITSFATSVSADVWGERPVSNTYPSRG